MCHTSIFWNLSACSSHDPPCIDCLAHSGPPPWEQMLIFSLLDSRALGPHLWNRLMIYFNLKYDFSRTMILFLSKSGLGWNIHPRLCWPLHELYEHWAPPCSLLQWIHVAWLQSLPSQWFRLPRTVIFSFGYFWMNPHLCWHWIRGNNKAHVSVLVYLRFINHRCVNWKWDSWNLLKQGFVMLSIFYKSKLEF